MEARKNLEKSRPVRELEREQWTDGRWARLHSKDYSAEQMIPTTEAGVERALALGLDAAHVVLRKACRYVTGVLGGKIHPLDRPEKNDRWPTGVRLFSASTLAQTQPAFSAGGLASRRRAACTRPYSPGPKGTGA